MALLNPPQILPTLAERVCWYLSEAEGRQERRTTLVELMAPASLGQNDGKAGSKALDDTVRACEQIGLISADGEYLRLEEEASAASKGIDADGFRALLRRRVLAPELNLGGWGSQEGARDLTYSLAWFLRQDLYSSLGVWDHKPPLRSVQAAQIEQLGNAVLIVNDARWGAFRRWSTYLGFARHHAFDDGGPVVTSYLVPDPTSAVRDALVRICIENRGELDLPSVVKMLSDQYPILDGGAYRLEVDAHVKESAKESTRVLSTGLAHAFRRLEAAGLFVLTDRADAARKCLFPAELGEQVVRSHISWSVPLPGRAAPR